MTTILAAIAGLFRRPQRAPYFLIVVHTSSGITYARPTPYPSRASARIARRLYEVAHPTTFAVIREVTR